MTAPIVAVTCSECGAAVQEVTVPIENRVKFPGHDVVLNPSVALLKPCGHVASWTTNVVPPPEMVREMHVRRLIDAATLLLHDFDAFGSAWEAKSPHSIDGARLCDQIRDALLALGVAPSAFDEDDPSSTRDG